MLAWSVVAWGVLLGLTAYGQTANSLRALPAEVVAPADNPTTPERVALGRLLFWDPILSGQKDVACASCHHPDFGYAEPLDVSIGANGIGVGAARTFAPGAPLRFVKRNSQTVLNAAFNGLGVSGHYAPTEAPMFWDLRVRSLEAQALEPIKALEEMRGDAYPEHRALDEVVARLRAIPGYRTQFARAFGRTSEVVTVQNLGRALAAFERSLVTPNTPFDRYMRGETTAMSPDQIRGMARFESVGCANCHNGPMLSDFAPHVIGVPDNRRLAGSDSGVNANYAFRTPSLRNLALTAPYMHNGVFATLGDVVNFYDRVRRGGGGRGRRGGGGQPARNANVSRDQLDPLVRQLTLRRGERDIVAFLGALSDDTFDRTIPDAVPSGLSVGGRIN